jgi:NAD(P)H-dependent FMN reductase
VADLKILGIPGSLRHASFNRFALKAAQSLVPPGASLDLFDLDGIPPYNQDLKPRVRAADMYPVNQPEVLIPSAAQRFNDKGELTDETSRELIRKLLTELVARTKRPKG